MYKFTYHDTGFSFATSGAGGYQYWRPFRGNSCYDPDYAGAGVQPYGFDQYCANGMAFGKYLVFGSKITVYPHIYTATKAGVNSTNSWAIKIAVVPAKTNSLNFTGIDDVMRMPWSRMRCIENEDDAGGNNTIKQYVSTRKLYPEAGRLEDADWGALYYANPNNIWYWNVVMDSTCYANDVTGYFDIKITYYTKLFKMQDVDES